jgi:acetamidase/formamidase
MSMGIAGSLDAAIKQATTQLAQWIENDYKLTPNEAAVVLGTSIQYEIAELVDPQVNVVAKVRKAVLTQLSK